MELRKTEEKINELLEAYEGIRRSPLLDPGQTALLPPVPSELGAGKSAGTLAPGAHADDSSLVRSLRATEAALEDLAPRAEKFRKRLFEIDPVTEQPRYGPKSRARVRKLVGGHDFLCAQFVATFPEERERRRLALDEYRRQQLDLREQRQEERRREHRKRQELLEQQREQERQDNLEESGRGKELPEPVVADANTNPDGSLIIDPSGCAFDDNDVNAEQTPPCHEASPASLLFAKLKEQHDAREQEKLRREASEKDARIKTEEETRRRMAEDEARQKDLERQRAERRAAEEKAQRDLLHQQAEEARVRRREQEEARREAERNYLDSIRKGPEGVKHYLCVLLRPEASGDRGEQGAQEEGRAPKALDPERIVALRSLCTLFEQIQKHPEEINNRKIRCANPNFHRDIGRHEGGIELLIAAGFRPTMLPAPDAPGAGAGTGENSPGNATGGAAGDGEEPEEPPDVAFLVSKEPNLEHDMDGWMAWFDLNKATLEILQTELQTIEGTNKRSRR